jgi:hypothetical protein
VYSIWCKNQHLEYAAPSGSVAMTLAQPTLFTLGNTAHHGSTPCCQTQQCVKSFEKQHIAYSDHCDGPPCVYGKSKGEFNNMSCYSDFKVGDRATANCHVPLATRRIGRSPLPHPTSQPLAQLEYCTQAGPRKAGAKGPEPRNCTFLDGFEASVVQVGRCVGRWGGWVGAVGWVVCVRWGGWGGCGGVGAVWWVRGGAFARVRVRRERGGKGRSLRCSLRESSRAHAQQLTRPPSLARPRLPPLAHSQPPSLAPLSPRRPVTSSLLLAW